MTGSVVARRRELGRCLRAYRDLTGPHQVGLAGTGRRRTPGLRREEVATLAGVGVTWYTWLEQGRVAASGQVIDAVGRVLGIDDVGRRHLRGLSQRPDSSAPEGGPPDPTSLLPVLASWSSDPAALLDARLDVVAVNDAWAHEWSADGHVLAALTAPGAGRGDDVTALLAALARSFRMTTDRHPTDGRLSRVRAELRSDAPWLGALWNCRGVGAFGRPRVRVGGVDREAYLLGEPGAPDAVGPAVLVLLPAPVAPLA